jgi:acetoin utilization deacetylase AcuC-like enzyme
MALIVVTSDRFADHVTPPGHPERVERAEAMQVVAARWRARGGGVVEPREATDQELVRVHDADYVQALSATRGRPVMLDPDTSTSPDSEEVARLAAGAVLVAIDRVMDQRGTRALAMVRPPGHHAERDRAMGFCLYNNIAVGAAAARHRGLKRVAIVDYDVHHGNGTQWSFYDDPSVLFVSSHQFPFYPGTGAADEIGRGEGSGFTVNLPMEVGATDGDYDLLFERIVIPALVAFEPELLLVSAGFDAHQNDPLAGMRMTTAGFRQITTRLLAAADDVCQGRAVFVSEGGYDTRALAECLEMVIDLASADRLAPVSHVASDTRRGEDTLRLVHAAHRHSSLVPTARS